MRASLLALFALPVAALAAEQSPAAAAPGQTESCADQYRKSGVMKGEMTRVVAADGTVSYVFTEKSPCITQPEPSSSPATKEGSSPERKPK
jgi:hypothetical protein